MGVDRKDMVEGSWVAVAGWVKCNVLVGGKKICRRKEHRGQSSKAGLVDIPSMAVTRVGCSNGHRLLSFT